MRYQQGLQVGGNSGSGSKIGASLFLGMFLAAGLLFLCLMGREVASIAAEYRWTPTPCTIVASALGTHGSDYRLDVRYRYAWQGNQYTSTVYQTGYTGSDDATDVERLMLRFPAGSKATCMVNPADPAKAILATRSYWFAAFALIPLLFVLVGAGGIYFVWRPQRPTTSSTSSAPARVLGVLFTLAGLGLFFGLVVPSVLEYWSARSWPAVPCVVESSRVRTHHGNKGDTYSIDILYRYRFGGKTYRSNRYDTSAGSSSGYDAKERIVRMYPPRERTVCFVNPADPLSAVLSREFPETDWLVGPLALIFAGVGIVVLVMGWRGAGQNTTVTGLGSGHFAGKPIRAGTGPAGRFMGLLAICCFWNGVVSVFLYQMIDGWRHGSGDLFLTIFLVPFELIGLGLVIGVGYSFLALFNPRPRISLGNPAISPGQSTTADWSFSRSPGRVRDFTITLIGEESAMVLQRSGRGNSSKQVVTDVFFQQPLIDATDSRQIANGRTQLTIPANTMHSLAARSNKVSWLLRVKGTIPHWPAIKQDFVVNVIPTPTAGRPAASPPPTDAPAPTSQPEPLRIGLPAGRTRFLPGESIDVTLAWDLDAPAKAIDARFSWHTTGRGDSVSAIVAERKFDSPAQRDHFTWRLHIPDGPWSFSGKLISLQWTIELRATPGNLTEQVELVIAPGGEAIRLADGPETSAAI